MIDLLINPKTKEQVEKFVEKPAQAVLLVGAKGTGKDALIKKISAQLLNLANEKQLESYPYFLHIKKQDDKQDISINQIRQLIKQIKLKTPGKAGIRRIVYIESADDLNQESANAILKILEEPSSETLYILSSNSIDSVLPTIASRCQKITINPVSQSYAVDTLSSDFDEKLVDAAWRLSNGRAGLLVSLLRQDNEHELKQAITEAKSYIHKSFYQRLLFNEELAKNKGQLNNFIEGLARVLSALHQSMIINGDKSQSQKILKSRQLVDKMREALENNGSPKLILLKLGINLIR